MRRFPLVLALPVAVLSLAPTTQGETVTLSARQLDQQAVTERVRMTDDGQALELAAGELVEDDGPAAGYSYRPNVEQLSDSVWIKKQLLVERPATRQATLLIAPGGELSVTVNGRKAPLGQPRKAGGYWQAYDLDPAILQPGMNELVVSGSGQVWIARDEDYAHGSTTRTRHPNRSAKSRDNGQTWDDARLGVADDMDGEYYVRLFLDHTLPEGRITTPVIDLGNLDDNPVGAAIESIGPIDVTFKVEGLDRGRLEVRYRRGATFAPQDATWTSWQSLRREAGQGSTAPAAGSLRFRIPADESPLRRYLQLEACLATDDPLSSPRVKSVSVTAQPRIASDWTTRLRVVEANNPPVTRTSIPFVFEPLDHPSLAELRDQHQLDQIVAGAKTELEIIERLAAWSATRWPKLGHLGEAYPPWDALKILASHGDGTPVGGFCLQFNLVFLQACESLGIPGRVVSIGPGDGGSKIRSGHEVVELWSNQFAKWIYVDGNAAWYAVDEANGAPLSLWELRERQLAAWAGRKAPPLRVVKLAETRYTWPDLHHWPAFAELRLVPRGNFLEQRAPLPLNQGMRGWFWTGHYVWSDQQQPASEIYAHRVVRRQDWEWSMNHAHIVLEPTATPGEVRVHLDSRTPGLDTYLAKFDDQPPASAEAVFPWKLRPGANRLTVRPRNHAGREGIASSLAVEYAK